jgi:carboxylesterase type B
MAAAGIAGAASRAFAATATSVPDPVVDTRHGRVRGQRGVAGGYKFFCVPYGASTEGEGRFMAPKPPAAWAGVREVPKQALIAPQTISSASAPGSRRAARALAARRAASVT